MRKLLVGIALLPVVYVVGAIAWAKYDLSIASTAVIIPHTLFAEDTVTMCPVFWTRGGDVGVSEPAGLFAADRFGGVSFVRNVPNALEHCGQALERLGIRVTTGIHRKEPVQWEVQNRKRGTRGRT